MVVSLCGSPFRFLQPASECGLLLLPSRSNLPGFSSSNKVVSSQSFYWLQTLSILSIHNSLASR